MTFVAPSQHLLAALPTPLTPCYMIEAVETSFNWDDIFANTDSGQWYLVAFRSKHSANADEERLEWLDAQARHAASESDGFLFYFMGVPLATGECLSFCLWNSKAEAAAASAKPGHRMAVQEGLIYFEYYTLEQYNVFKQGGQVIFQPLHKMALKDSAPHVR
ncbi:MAG: hypothetical protein ACOYL5_16440 [Phototrophicaceae bacterium]|jgi:hypothetical protein